MKGWMRPSRVSGWDLAESGWDLAEWLERLAVNAKVATALGSIPASSDSVKPEGAADEAVLNNVHTDM